MPVPAAFKQRAAAMLDEAWDAWQAGQAVNLVERFNVDGRSVKLHVLGRDPDHPKEVILRIKWRSAEA